MSSLRVMVNARKYLRGSIAKQYNSDNLSRLSEVEKMAIREKFNGILMKTEDYDSRITDIKWSESLNDDEFALELSTCERYVDQINEILTILTDRPNVVSENRPRSLLKNPVIPLPVFNSITEENIDKFFQEFESV